MSAPERPLTAVEEADRDHPLLMRAAREAIAYEQRIERLEAQVKRYEDALRRIAGEDYRGNRPWSAHVASIALTGGSEQTSANELPQNAPTGEVSRG